MQNPAVLAVILFIATLFVFRSVRHFDFINFDDPEYVTSNPQVRDGLSMNGIFWALTATRQQLASSHVAFPYAGQQFIRRRSGGAYTL